MLAISSCVIFSCIRRQTVERQQQPAAQLLVDRVMAVANRRLRHLGDQRLGVPQQHVQQIAMTVELVFEALAREPIRRARTLDDRTIRRGFTAHEQRHADRTLVAYHRDLRRSAVLQDIQQRDDRIDRKIDMAESSPDS